jgi:hypothetical protein
MSNSVSNTRLIMYHKHPTSARLRFLKLSYGGVCGFEPLPTLSQLLDEKPEDFVAAHPAPLVNAAERQLGMDTGELEADGEYKAYVDVPEGVIQVYLARFTGIDPPFDAAEAQGAEFVDLPQARNMTQVELELLRKAYEVVMTG